MWEQTGMKHLNGKRIKLWDINGHVYQGVCTGVSDDVIKMLKEDNKDERCFFIKNIFSYQVVGGGTTGGYSGLKVYICKNEMINCKGVVRISAKQCHIKDMGCDVCKAKTTQGVGLKCDFGCIGALQVLPSPVQRSLFQGMMVNRNKINLIKEK